MELDNIGLDIDLDNFAHDSNSHHRLVYDKNTPYSIYTDRILKYKKNFKDSWIMTKIEREKKTVLCKNSKKFEGKTYFENSSWRKRKKKIVG